MTFLRALFCLIGVFVLPAHGASSFNFPKGRVELVQKPNEIGLHFKMAPEWHIYWKNSGDSGAAPKWTWTVENGQVGEAQWPLPERIPVAGMINLGYANEALFKFAFTPNDPKSPSSVRVNLEFLICKIECIPYFTELTTPIGKTGAPEMPSTPDLYPQKNANLSWQIIQRHATSLETELILPTAVKNIEIFPEDGETYRPQVPQLEPHENRFRLFLPLQDTSREEFGGDRFLVVTEDDQGVRAGYEVSLQKKSTSLALILFWALLGGMILNLMPCVFPVLSIKIISFLGPDKNPQALRRSGWFYTLGVLFSFFTLGLVLLLLRAGGEQIGWGFQLQSPLITAGIAILFFWLGLNFLGLYEIGQSLAALGSRKTSNSAWGSLGTGVLATVVATPCTAPFMGAALGASLALPAPQTLLVFVGLGLGMALPFLALAYFPQALRLLPKPGLWMQKFKEFLAFPLFATVLWLLWVLSIQKDASALLWILGIFLFVAAWIWLAGLVKNEKLRQRFLVIGFLLSLSLILFLPQGPTATVAAPAASTWKDFSPEKLSTDLSQGRAVFIDFTAAWCITCQVNKKLVLNTDVIQKIFADRGVSLYRADWTDKNPMITEALASFGRNSLPVYVYYALGSDRPQLLPEILTQNMIIDLLTKENP